MQRFGVMVHVWVGSAIETWRTRRGEEGGVLDEVAMIGIMVGAAVLVGGGVLFLLTNKMQGLNLGW